MSLVRLIQCLECGHQWYIPFQSDDPEDEDATYPCPNCDMESGQMKLENDDEPYGDDN